MDRDGTLIPDLGYLSNPAHVKLYAGTARALKLLRRAGFFLFVVTNQSGVARGFFPISTVKAVNRKLQALLRAKSARIDDFFYCPHYQGGEVKALAKVCDCRKPKPGMVKQALRKFPVDLSNSYVVGDKIDDILLAHNAKVPQGILVMTGNGRKSRKLMKAHLLAKTAVASDVLSAAKWILENSKK